jgi:hypothetical protein
MERSAGRPRLTTGTLNVCESFVVGAADRNAVVVRLLLSTERLET